MINIMRAIICLAVLSFASGCGVLDLTPAKPKTEQEIKDEFKVIVESANSCNANDQCIMINPGCPLGCSAFINANEKEAVQKAAESLIERWSDLGDAGHVAPFASRPVRPFASTGHVRSRKIENCSY